MQLTGKNLRMDFNEIRITIQEVIFNTKAQDIVNKVISYRHNGLEDKFVTESNHNRSSEIAWLGDRE